MTINNGNVAANNTKTVHYNMNAQTDAVSKSIQDRITNAQKQMQELAANKDLTPEEKMKKRQEFQQEITDLNQQLRQHQIEQRKERQSEKASAKEDGGNQKTDTQKQGAGFSTAGMQAMLSADSSMKQAKVQGSVAAQMKGRAGVLKTEIKLDAARGGDTSAKEAELAKVEQKAENASDAQISTLTEANQTMKEAGKADKDTKPENENSRADKADDNEQREGEASPDAAANEDAKTHVDIRL